jgi:hypothetical protein
LILPIGRTRVLTRAGAVGEKESIDMIASGSIPEENNVQRLVLGHGGQSIEEQVKKWLFTLPTKR